MATSAIPSASLALGALVALALPAAATAKALPMPQPGASGIVHVVSEPTRILPEAGKPGVEGSAHEEVWYSRDGSSWRYRQVLPRGGVVEQIATRRGIRYYGRGGDDDGHRGRMFTPAGKLPHDYLRDPSINLRIEPRERLRSGELRQIGRTTVDGEPALVLQEVRGDTERRYLMASDDGALLGEQFTARVGDGNCARPDCSDHELRTAFDGVRVYERLPATKATQRRVRTPSPAAVRAARKQAAARR